MNIRIHLIIRLLAIIAVSASSYQLHANSSTPVYSAIPGLDCVINPYLVVDISSPVAGVIEKLYVERSQQVTAGQDLAQLESSVERATVDLARYRAGLSSGIGLGKVNLKFDQLRKRRVDSLIDEENVSREIVDQVERDVQLANWNLKQAVETAKIRDLELHRSEELLNQKSIKAPFDGFVLDTFKYRGEYVDDQAILRLAQLDPLVIEAIVPMEHFGSIKPGMYADVKPEVFRDKKLLGKVTAVDRMGDTASNTFGVKLTMPNPGNRIPAGLKCVLKFIDLAPEQITDLDRKQARHKKENSPISVLADTDNQAAEKLNSDHTTSSDTPVLAAAVEALPSRYIVLIKQPDTKVATQKLLNRLIVAGVNNFQKYNNGTDQRLISLGVYSKRTNAENRQEKLDQLGFGAFTLELFN